MTVVRILMRKVRISHWVGPAPDLARVRVNDPNQHSMRTIVI